MKGSIEAILGVPDFLEIHTIVPVGYGQFEPPPAYHRTLEEIVHFEQYDRSKFRSIDEVINFLRKLRKRSRAG